MEFSKKRRTEYEEKKSEKILVEILADSLSRFSMDLVKLVYKYMVFPMATENAKASRFFFFLLNDCTCQQKQIACDPSNGNIWTTWWTEDRLLKESLSIFNSEGQFLRHANVTCSTPSGIDFFQNGIACIVDYQLHTIIQCEPERRFGADQICLPHGLAIDKIRELIYVLEGQSSLIKIFTKEGQFRGHWILPLYFKHPTSIAVNSSTGEVGVCVSDEKKIPCVCVFDCKGETTRQFAHTWQRIQLEYGKSLAVDHVGNWIVCSFSENNVRIFTNQGEMLTMIQDDSLFQPAGVCVHPEGQLLVYGSHPCQVFAYAFTERGEAPFEPH